MSLVVPTIIPDPPDNSESGGVSTDIETGDRVL